MTSDAQGAFKECPHAPSLIIGAGNRWRRDDGAGPAVAEALAALHLPRVVVLTTGGEGATLLDLWHGAEFVVLIDAATGPPPGTVRRFDVRRDALSPELFGGNPPGATHAFGIVQAVELARALGRLPRHLIIFALAGQDFGHGEGLSPAVAAAIPRLVQRIACELASVTSDASRVRNQ